MNDIEYYAERTQEALKKLNKNELVLKISQLKVMRKEFEAMMPQLYHQVENAKNNLLSAQKALALLGSNPKQDENFHRVSAIHEKAISISDLADKGYDDFVLQVSKVSFELDMALIFLDQLNKDEQAAFNEIWESTNTWFCSDSIN